MERCAAGKARGGVITPAHLKWHGDAVELMFDRHVGLDPGRCYQLDVEKVLLLVRGDARSRCTRRGKREGNRAA